MFSFLQSQGPGICRAACLFLILSKPLDGFTFCWNLLPVVIFVTQAGGGGNFEGSILRIENFMFATRNPGAPANSPTHFPHHFWLGRILWFADKRVHQQCRGEPTIRGWGAISVPSLFHGGKFRCSGFHMPPAMQGRPICHSLPVMRVKLVSGPDVCSNVDTGIQLTPPNKATVTPVVRNKKRSMREGLKERMKKNHPRH